MADQKKQVTVAEVVRFGEKIVIPEKLPIANAVEVLKRQMAYEETQVQVNEVINCYPWDGARALKIAMEEKFGVAMASGHMGFFGWEPPKEQAIEVGYGVTEQVPWGRFKIAVADKGAEDYIETSYRFDNSGVLVFALTGIVRRKYQHLVSEVATLVRDIIRTRSMYRGKAIRMKFRDENGDPYPLPNPRFWKRSNATPIFEDGLAGLVEANIYTPLKYREACEASGIPFKRGVLLEGPYGTGKTMVAGQTAELAIENGITFIYLEDVRELAEGIRFAQQYAPAVIFAEDIDRATQGNERTTDIDKILNTIDGVDSKSSEIMVVLTTNHLETINQAMLRPGRLDVVLHVTEPDAKAAAKLVQLYAGTLLHSDTDLTKVGQMLAGQIPAIIRETVERSKLGVVTRTGRVPSEGSINSDDLVQAAATLEQQRKLLEPQPEDTRSNREKAAERLGTLIQHGLATIADQAAGRRDGGGENGQPPISLGREPKKLNASDKLTTGV